MNDVSAAVLAYVDLLRSTTTNPDVLRELRFIEGEHRPEVGEPGRQEALTLALGQVTCEGDHSEPSCDECGAVV